MNKSDIARLAGRLEAARCAGFSIDVDKEGVRPADRAAAIGAALAQLRGEAPAAWKLGGTNPATRDVFAVDAPYFGPLKADEAFSSGIVLDRGAYPAPLRDEPEIAVAFACGFAPQAERRSEEELRAAIDWVAPAIELPGSALADPASAGVDWLVADRCAAGALVVGEKRDAASLAALERAAISLRRDGEACAGPAMTLIGGVLGAVADTLVEFTRFGLSLEKGVILATGGLAPAVAVDACSRIEAEFATPAETLSVAASFTG